MSRMFMGEYNHTIDAKGRIIIPSKFREILGENFVITKGLDGCLWVFSAEEWNLFYENSAACLLPEKTPVILSETSWRMQTIRKSISREES